MLKGLDENNEKFIYSIEQMRMQRHDFMNYLQVIYGYIQINKPQEAINYINHIISKMNVFSSFFNLNNLEIALVLQEFFANCSKNGIEIEFYTELEYISSDIFSKNINNIRSIFNNVTKIISDAQIRNTDSQALLYMNIFEIEAEIIFIIGISNEVIEEIDESKYEGITELAYSNTDEKVQINIYKNNSFLDAVEIRFAK